MTLTWESAHAWNFDDITLVYYLEHDFYILVNYIFNVIPLSICDVIYDITI